MTPQPTPIARLTRIREIFPLHLNQVRDSAYINATIEAINSFMKDSCISYSSLLGLEVPVLPVLPAADPAACHHPVEDPKVKVD
jgi:hypothetical protein